MLRILTIALVAFSAVTSQDARGGELDLGGSIGAEARVFLEDPAWAGQSGDPQLSAILEATLRWRSEDRRYQIILNPWTRIDSLDDERTHFDLREGFVRYSGNAFTIEAGLIKVFWGVTESRHLVDIINQTDTVEDIDSEDKLGQPAVRVTHQRDWGLLELFVMPAFRERTFAGAEGRFRTPLPVDYDNPIWENNDEKQHLDFAGRWSHYIGDWDVGIGGFHGTGREPTFQPALDGMSLRPRYSVISQVSADVQLTRGAWLWKLEALHRWGEGDPFAAVTAGVEYTFFGVTETGADLGLLAEFHLDGRNENPTIAPPTPFDNDVFVGGRFALNDAADTSILGGAIIDIDDASTSMLIEAERRIGQNYVLEVEGRFFANVDETDALFPIRRDNTLTVRLTRYF